MEDSSTMQVVIPRAKSRQHVFGQYIDPNRYLHEKKMDKMDPNYIPLDNNHIDSTTLCHIFSPVDLEDLFARSPGARIVNNEAFTTMSLSEDFRQAIYSNNDGDIGFTPTCQCGKLKGRFYAGAVCGECNTTVTTDYVDKLSHTAWVGTPHGMAPFLHPVWYFVLSSWSIGGKGIPPIIEIILDPDKDVPEVLQHIITSQGFGFFYENVDRIFNYFFNEHPWNTSGRRTMEWIKVFYGKYRNILFTTKLPILHNSLHPIMKNGNSLKYADRNSKEILEAIFNLSTLSFVVRNSITTKKHEVRSMYQIYTKIIAYYRDIIKTKVGSKEAIIRHHNLGTRCHWSYRTVCTPITGPHEADELHLPYKLVVNALKLPILNVLVYRKRFTISDALVKHLKSMVVFDQEIYDIMIQLIAECPWKGLPTILGRNPTLKMFAIQMLFLTHVKKDINDETLSLSPLILSNANID